MPFPRMECNQIAFSDIIIQDTGIFDHRRHHPKASMHMAPGCVFKFASIRENEDGESCTENGVLRSQPRSGLSHNLVAETGMG